MTPTDHQLDNLAAQAEAARAEAYAPYSGFAVGAALLVADGRVFRGVNVESSSYGLTICAERAAVFSAVTAGARDFVAIAVAAPGAAAPCGACRQVLCEFAHDATILLVDALREKPIRRLSLSALLPEQFHLAANRRGAAPR